MGLHAVCTYWAHSSHDVQWTWSNSITEINSRTLNFTQFLFFPFDIYSAPVWERWIAISSSVCVSVCMSVCLSASISLEPLHWSSRNLLCRSPVAVARSSSGGVAIPERRLISMNALLLSPGRGEQYCDQPVCLCVCLSASISLEPLDRSARNFVCGSPMAVARSSSGDIALCYVLPVLWMTSRLAVMGATPKGGGWHVPRLPWKAWRYRGGVNIKRKE